MATTQSNPGYEKCPSCGDPVEARVMAWHRSTARCRAASEVRTQLRKGNILCGRYWQVLRSVQLAVKVRTRFQEAHLAVNGRYYAARVKEQWWAPTWAYIIASGHFLRGEAPGRSHKGRCSYELASPQFEKWFARAESRRQLIAVIREDIDMQESLSYCHGQRLDPAQILEAYAREKGLCGASHTDK